MGSCSKIFKIYTKIANYFCWILITGEAIPSPAGWVESARPSPGTRLTERKFRSRCKKGRTEQFWFFSFISSAAHRSYNYDSSCCFCSSSSCCCCCEHTWASNGHFWTPMVDGKAKKRVRYYIRFDLMHWGIPPPPCPSVAVRLLMYLLLLILFLLLYLLFLLLLLQFSDGEGLSHIARYFWHNLYYLAKQ